MFIPAEKFSFFFKKRGQKRVKIVKNAFACVYSQFFPSFMKSRITISP